MKQVPLIEPPKLNRYSIKFFGRKNTSIGKRYAHELTIEAASSKDAELQLYNNYDHITVIKIKEI